jgi:iron only hydrogenase large subunit-like protein
MVACGRTIKRNKAGLQSTVFIGPCIAKKQKRVNKDIADAVDYVLTSKKYTTYLKRLTSTFRAWMMIARDHSSMTGRFTRQRRSQPRPYREPYQNSIPAAG